MDHRGAYYEVRDYTLLPRPLQRPHPPIWIGGRAEAVLHRTGRWADAYIPVHITPQEYASLYRKVESYARECGRDPASITRALHIHLCLADTPAEAQRITSEVLTKRYQRPTSPPLDGTFLFGPPDECRRIIQGFVDVGVTHFVLNMTCHATQALSQLEVVSQEILPHRK